MDYIEGGWPGANPTDSAFFDAAPETRARMTAFGMTKRAGRSAENDDVLAAVHERGHRHGLPRRQDPRSSTSNSALGITLDENLENIRASVAHVVAQGREALFDAEHFFDGYRADPAYALRLLDAALDAGARWIVLCDTNGGTLPRRIGEIVGGGDRGGHARRPARHPHPQRHRDTPWPARWPPSTRARGRSRAR